MKRYIYMILLLVSGVYSAYLRDIPIIVYQPDGTEINCYATGDEYYSWLHDGDGYTIIQSQSDGYYYFAKAVSGTLLPTDIRVDSMSPDKTRLEQWVGITVDEYRMRRTKFWENVQVRDAPTIGTVNNINIFVRFADENEFSTPRSVMDEPFNKEEGPSLYHYYDEVSYSQLEVITHHFPVCPMSTNLSYQDQYPRSYYEPYNSQTNPNGYTENQRTIREHTLLRNAIQFIDSEVPAGLDVDGDDDGKVDNVTFLVSGSPTGWSDLLWPHRWSLYSFNVFINNRIVDSYNFNLATGGYFTVNTLCHEFFHSMGAPDLYHYNGGGAPTSVGGWDIMDGGSGYMGAWMKYKYGHWIECPEIETMGIFPILPLQSQQLSCYQVDSPNSSHEFFVVEYRKQEGIYEINLPGNQDGMLIYRIDGYLDGNAQGPPDEVYLYRPGGTTNVNGNLNAAIFSAETGRTEINDSTDPSSFLYGGAPGGLNIQDIGYPGDIMEFVYWNIFINTSVVGITNDNDGDGLLNPGETGQLTLDVQIQSGPSNAENATVTLTSPYDWVHFNPSIIEIGSLPMNGNHVEIETSISIDNIEDLMPAVFVLEINADFDDDGTIVHYTDEFDFELDVTLNQVGFPLATAEIRSSPLIIDLNNDGDNEIIFGDYSGVVHIYFDDGTEYFNGTFPFETGNQIWGSPAAADLDGDSYIDFVITSKSRHLYIFDYNGLKTDYETELYLIGTPAIGNVDDDPELEIVFSGYSSNNKIFAINFDGSDVDGFPIDFSERVKAGVALADFNNNGKDDIVLGTDDDFLYLILDDGSTAPGFPFLAGDKIQTAPSILEANGEKIIITGCNDNRLYAVNSDGSLRFSVLTGDKIQVSPSVMELNGELFIFFGSKDDKIYAVDLNGNALSGWPVNLGNDIIASPCFADFDGDGSSEIVTAINGSEIFVLYNDGTTYPHFPINTGGLLRGAITNSDLDLDGDLEIFIGSGESLQVIDVKETGDLSGMWSMYRNNTARTGYYQPAEESMQVFVNYIIDWNLVGLPLNVEDPYYLSVYPDAIEETLFSFAYSYIQETEFEHGNGYWLRFDSAGTTAISGSSLSSVSVQLNEDWNLIAGLSTVTSISSISDPDNLIIPGTIYGFTGGYVEASELEPGKGYWIRSFGEGSITISSGMQARTREFTNYLEGANSLTINGQTLYFGIDVPEEHKLSYSLPPKPPSGATDIRFSGDTKLCATDDCVIEVMNKSNPLNVEFDIKDGDVWEITDESGNVFECSGVNVLELIGDSEKWVLRKFITTVPTIFALHTAYPNPFNPVTTIQFSVQTHGNASLRIYDITGKLVETLVDDFIEPGNHSVQWHASNFSSGIYFYKLTSGNKTTTNKMILMK